MGHLNNVLIELNYLVSIDSNVHFENNGGYESFFMVLRLQSKKKQNHTKLYSLKYSMDIREVWDETCGVMGHTGTAVSKYVEVMCVTPRIQASVTSYAVY